MSNITFGGEDIPPVDVRAAFEVLHREFDDVADLRSVDRRREHVEGDEGVDDAVGVATRQRLIEVDDSRLRLRGEPLAHPVVED
jgi:hypothetical protein